MRTRRIVGVAGAVVATVAVVAACGGTAHQDAVHGEVSHVTSDAGGTNLDSLRGAADGAYHGPANAAPPAAQVAAGPSTKPAVTRRSVIRTGDVRLTGDDVAGIATKVRAVASTYHGLIDDEQTRAKAGDVTADSLTLRIPSAHFGGAYADLKRLGTLVSATSSTEDVTTQLIDVGVRVRAQRAGLRRVQTLLSRAATIREVLAIEGQLTQRQSRLDSLERRQAYLTGQTSMSTITVAIARAKHAHHAPPAHRTGFIGGLHRGWHGLVSTARAAAAGVGTVLPFAAVAVVVLVPLWVLRRRRRSAAGA